MSFLQPLMLLALPLIAIPILIHLINQWRYQTKPWGAMMFLLAANRMNRGYARLRQWIILAMRVLAIAGLIFAVSRPLTSSFLSLTGGRSDTTLVLLDRSPSMQQQGTAGQSKLLTGRKQLAEALQTLGSNRWVLIDSNATTPQSFDSLASLVDSPRLSGSSATADIPKMLQSASDYLTTNKPGPTDIWICSDLRTSDWSTESANWKTVREALKNSPQSVQVHLLAYPEPAENNLSIRVSEVQRDSDSAGETLGLSMQLTQTASGNIAVKRMVPVQIEIDGARSELNVELNGRDVLVRNHRVPLGGQKRGSGKVTLPADQNNADNEYYFVYDDAPPRRTVLVSDDREASRPLEIAAAIASDGQMSGQVDVLAPQELDSLVLDGAALLIWQASLPTGDMSRSIKAYVQDGGQVLFFPPTSVTTGIGDTGAEFLGVRWLGWAGAEANAKVVVENWRSDQDLLAVTRSGAGLPVGELELSGHATLRGDVSSLATLTGGHSLLARVPTDGGAVYFCTASTSRNASTLATNGIVLYALIQRAIEQGVTAQGNASQRVAGEAQGSTDDWRQLVGSRYATEETLSDQYAWQAGVYERDGQHWAVNRSLREDQSETVDDQQLERLFAGLNFSRVNDQAGSVSGIVREVWQLFLLTMIVAMLLEAILCMPRRQPLARLFPRTPTP